jgi:hypothetical protein
MTKRMQELRFGRTWWGRAWVDALEQRAQLDPNPAASWEDVRPRRVGR